MNSTNNKHVKKEQPKQVSSLSQHDLGEAFLSLAKELWVTKDRLAIMEAAFIEHGHIRPETVSKFQPDENLQQQLTEDRERYILTLLKSLQPK
jgi:hypothetical protein